MTRILRAMDWLDGAGLSEFDAAMWENAFIEHGARFEIAAGLVKKDLQDLGMTASMGLSPFNHTGSVGSLLQRVHG